MLSNSSGTSHERRSPRQEEKAAANSLGDGQIFLSGNSGGCAQRVWDDREDEGGTPQIPGIGIWNFNLEEMKDQ